MHRRFFFRFHLLLRLRRFLWIVTSPHPEARFLSRRRPCHHHCDMRYGGCRERFLSVSAPALRVYSDPVVRPVKAGAPGCEAIQVRRSCPRRIPSGSPDRPPGRDGPGGRPFDHGVEGVCLDAWFCRADKFGPGFWAHDSGSRSRGMRIYQRIVIQQPLPLTIR